MTKKGIPRDAFTSGNSDMQGGNSNQQFIDDAVNEALERELKKRNIVKFNLPEIPNDVHVDMQAIKYMAKEMKQAPPSIVEVCRFINAEPCPFCVTFSSDNYKWSFLRNFRELHERRESWSTRRIA